MAWKHLQHINILPLLGATIGDNKLSLISEWMDQGSIVQYLDRMEHLEVNRIELVSCGYLVEGPSLICVVDRCCRRIVVYTRPSHGSRKPERGMPLPLTAQGGSNLFPSFKENVYIRNYRACIAGLSISTMASEEPWAGGSAASTAPLPTFTTGETLPWMSPELLDPSMLEDGDPRPTKESDCFALGMLVYEVRVCSLRQPPTHPIVHPACRCYADTYRTMVGIRRELRTPY